MSGLIVGLVLRLKITDKFNKDAKFIATVYADHAWEDGTHAYPAVSTVAGITGISERSVQRYLRTLKGIKLLVPDGKGPRGTNRYKFPVVEKDGGIRLDVQWGGVSVSPLPNDGGDSISGDSISGDSISGDSIVSPEQTNKPSLTTTTLSGSIFKIYEDEIGALTPMVRDALNEWIDDADFPDQWIIDAIRRAVVQNKRSWAYVRAILRDWKAKGKQDTRPAKPSRFTPAVSSSKSNDVIDMVLGA